jgi:2-dehydro-3-deoxy-D-arabinonate dehydratase
MKLCRFQKDSEVRIGVIADRGMITDLTAAGAREFTAIMEREDAPAYVRTLLSSSLPQHHIGDVKVLAPVERQEVWAVGVTYLRSKTARMEESDFSATAYDKVYDAPRPELFFKSMPEKVVGFGDKIGIRRDAKWNVPEPELALVLNSRGKIVGYTIGNDMSSRDIEGENLLYLPQAKIYERSCALGPFITIGATETDVRTWKIEIQITRDERAVFSGDVLIGRIKRTFQELAEYLFRSQSFPHGAVLLTGTGVVPNEDFTLQPGDVVRIDVDGIGSLENSVVVV